jgi:hypothetical protein
MSRQTRERSSLGFIAGLASVAACMAALGCSSSEARDDSSVVEGCDTARGGCASIGAACTRQAECASGNCSAGECVALVGTPFGVGGSGSNPQPSIGGAFGFVDDLDQGGTGGVQSCVDLDVDFERVTPTVVLLIDQSGSMTQAFDNGLDRWETLVETLTDPQGSLIKKLEGSVRFGMALYTSQNGFGVGSNAVCPILTNVDIALGNFSEMSAVLLASTPEDDTPTAESMSAVAKQLKAFAEDGPKSIILATDGDPDTCEEPDSNDSDASKLRSVDAVKAAFADGIPTHVISVGDEITASHLKALAVAGAGGDLSAEAYTALDTAALESAFNEIIGSVRTCDFTLQGSVAPKDAARGTVILDGKPLVFADPNGWEMPTRTTVRLLGEACEIVQGDATGISMRFPCDAIDIIPR